MHEPGDTSTPMRRGDDEGDYVEFWPAGVAASGRFSCAACGNVVNARMVLPRCLMCGERLWERVTPSFLTELEARRNGH
jgi:hypothetical protein